MAATPPKKARKGGKSSEPSESQKRQLTVPEMWGENTDPAEKFMYLNMHTMSLFLRTKPELSEFKKIVGAEWERLDKIQETVDENRQVIKNMKEMETKIAPVSVVLAGEHLSVSMAQEYHVMVRNKVKLNASYMDPKKTIIGSERPGMRTVQGFWEMILDERVTDVVNLIDTDSGKKAGVISYVPPHEKDELPFGKITVTCVGEQSSGNLDHRTLSVTELKSPPRVVNHWHYTKWPDNRVPILPEEVKKLLVRFQRPGPDMRLVVHCSAGRGRTGTFVAALLLFRRISMLEDVLNDLVSRLDIPSLKECICVSVPRVVVDIRNRRHKVVATLEQYEYLYRATADRLDVVGLRTLFPSRGCRGAGVASYASTKLAAVLEMGAACSFCGSAPANLWCCGCMVARYCSEKCQRLHLEKTHFFECPGTLLYRWCWRCGTSRPLHSCAACGEAWYCSEECARVAWVAGHWASCSHRVF